MDVSTSTSKRLDIPRFLLYVDIISELDGPWSVLQWFIVFKEMCVKKKVRCKVKNLNCVNVYFDLCTEILVVGYKV